jgi:hypothetical protein
MIKGIDFCTEIKKYSILLVFLTKFIMYLKKFIRHLGTY